MSSALFGSQRMPRKDVLFQDFVELICFPFMGLNTQNHIFLGTNNYSAVKLAKYEKTTSVLL